MSSVEKVEAKNGQPTLRLRSKQGRQVFLHSSYDPQKEADSWASKLDFGPDSMMVLFGLGLGYHLRALLPLVQSSTKIIVIEPNDEVVQAARELEGNRSLFDQETIHIVKDWNGFKETYLRVGNPWDNLFFSKIPVYPQVYENEYLSFIKKFQKEVNSLRANLCTVLFFSERWQRNLFKNLRFLKESARVASIFGEFKKKPVIIVSAGPSLMENIDQLHKAKGKALIIAVGTVIKLLLHHDILPDLVISFDGGPENYEGHFKGVKISDVPLVYDPTIYYKIVEEYGGPKALMLIDPGNLWLEDYLDGPIGFLKTGPSVANTALSLACRLEADPIIFVGQDLAHTGGLTHAEHTHGEGHDYRIQTNEKTVWLDGFDGKSVPSDKKMLTYLHSLEEEIRLIEGKRTIIDATEGGAKIAGTKIIPLSKTLELYCTEDLSERIEFVKAECSTPQACDLSPLVSYLESAKTTMEKLIPQCTKSMRLARKLVRHFSDNKPCNIRKILIKLEKMDKKLKKEQAKYPLLHYLLAPLGLVREAKVEAWKDLEVSEQSYQLYASLKRAFAYSVPFLEELITALDDGIPESVGFSAVPSEPTTSGSASMRLHS